MSRGKAIWRSIRKPLADSQLVKRVLARIIHGFIRLVVRTNPQVAGSQNPADKLPPVAPAILAFWHGQHLMYPALNRDRTPVVAMVSRSADAELNALVAQLFGLTVVRGSGGREGRATPEKGGARALIALKKALDGGTSVAMIADIPHGRPREAGLGIVTLARISGRPILPAAYATSRRKVLEKSWDKTTINLPFGRGAIAFGDPVWVRPDADEAAMEEARQRVTASLNEATEKAYGLVDGKR